jgi:dihydropteroate synthase
MALDRPRIMGILNVTPDSFSDGGMHAGSQDALSHALRMLDEGADIIDVGGESTRPGSQRVAVDEQIRRTAAAVAAIVRRRPEAVISIDTTRSEVARRALDEGALIINDVAAGRDDPAILQLAAGRGVPIILMHMLGRPATMQADPRYDDVVGEVQAFLLDRAAEAMRAGVPRAQIVIDPGIGFGKTRDHNLTLIAHLDRLAATGYPVLLGTSRKRFMGSICTPATGPAAGTPPPPTDLVGATCATTALGVAAGVRLFRVHDVKPNRQAADVAWALRKDQP